MQEDTRGVAGDGAVLKSAGLLLAAFCSVVGVAATAVAGPAHDTTRGMANFAKWVGSYKDQVGGASQSVYLHRIPGLSEEDATATGRVAVNLENGAVTVQVDGLLPPESGTTYAVLLVDNTPGPGNSVALDRGPGGDSLIDVGALVFHDSQAGLEAMVGPRRLDDFELDMAIVTRRSPSGSEAIVIGGLFSVVQKIAARDRQDLLRAAHAAWLRPFRFGLFSALMEQLPGPPPATATAPAQRNPALTTLIDEGRTVFLQEQFSGNGRTCGTCHQPESNFTIDVGFIAKLPADDPLFVAEFDPNLANLENPTLMRTQARILENIDGFDKAPVRGPRMFRTSASRRRLAGTTTLATCRTCCVGAVMQHLRRPCTGWRAWTLHTDAEEVDAMEAFSRQCRRHGRDLRPRRAGDQPAEQRGRAWALSPVAKCSSVTGGRR